MAVQINIRLRHHIIAGNRKSFFHKNFVMTIQALSIGLGVYTGSLMHPFTYGCDTAIFE
ncbi:hypothetical protein [Dendronalium phyllosphericum]|uniref:hypothetical protein n=1 Tax=Dendronalium phyllosphericum TaxID=2840445 RepID=UPI001CECB40C|nr:hypothetical protein [Dendronalium phyllosphericum]